MDKFDFSCVTGVLIGLAGVKLNLIKINTWGNVFGYVICFAMVTYILSSLNKKK